MTYEDVIDSEKIETTVGDYLVEWISDIDVDQPYDHGFTLAVDGRTDYTHDSRIDINEGDTSDQLWRILRSWRDGYDTDLRSGAALVRWLTLRGCKGVTLVDEGYRQVEPSSDRYERIHGVAWAPDDATDPKKYVESSLEEWRAWAEGDTFGWRVIDPSGNEVASVWGYYGFDREREYTLSEARSAAEYDANDREEKANLAGAGIVGII